MQNCLNTDVIYQGMTFHVQTEDLGRKGAYFQTQVYYRGKILTSQRFYYTDLLGGGKGSEELEERIQREHDKAVDRVRKGQINIDDLEPILTSSDRPDKKSGKIKIVAKADRFGRKAPRRSLFQTSSEQPMNFRRTASRAHGILSGRRWVPILVSAAFLVLVAGISLPRFEPMRSKEVRFDRLLTQARTLRQNGAAGQARELLTRAVDLFPNRSQAYIQRAEAWAQDHAWTRALEDLNRAAQLDPANGAIFFRMGQMQLEAAETVKALESMEKAVQGDYRTEEVYETLGRTYYSIGNLARSEENWLALLRIHPEDAAARTYLGRIALKRESYGQAIREFEEAVRIDPEGTEAYLLLGQVYAMTGLKDKARGIWTRALELDPENRELRARLERTE